MLGKKPGIADYCVSGCFGVFSYMDGCEPVRFDDEFNMCLIGHVRSDEQVKPGARYLIPGSATYNQFILDIIE